jgi:stage V sporulation protein AD
MTINFKNVYLNASSTVTGSLEKEGPLGNYFDATYKDAYLGEKTWELAEQKLLTNSIELLLNKLSKTRFDIDLLISGDLLNQITTSNYTSSFFGIPYFGVYAACATSAEGLIIGASLIDNKQIKNCICATASHNSSAEKQFRYPTEYGCPKPKISTYTVTGGASAYLSSKKDKIKIESGTIGRVIDLGIKDAFNMGAAMAPAAANTIVTHLEDTGRTVDYYDLIVTGDLGEYGKEILIDYMKEEYGIKLSNYEDCGLLLYDREKQPVFAGGSGPVCSALVLYGYLLSKMKKKQYKKILFVATGALFSKDMVNQKQTLPAIAHAVSLEVVE